MRIRKQIQLFGLIRTQHNARMYWIATVNCFGSLVKTGRPLYKKCFKLSQNAPRCNAKKSGKEILDQHLE